MTMHSYRPSADMDILVEMGYDRPLNRLFLTIYRNKESPFDKLEDEDIIYDCEEDEIIDGPYRSKIIIYDCLDDSDRSTFTDHSIPKTDLLAYFCRKIMDVSKGAWDIPDQMKLNILEDAFVCRGNQFTTYEDDL